MATTTRKKSRKIHRDAATGRTVSKKYAEDNPTTTVAETIAHKAGPAQVTFYPIVSSNLEKAGFDESEQICIVHFKNGSAYKYPEFSADLWQEWRHTFDGSSSAGSFFHVHIRNLPNEKIENWK